LASVELRQPPHPPPPIPQRSAQRIDALVRAQFAFVWRSLRRLGVSAAEADDCAQQVFLVAARRLAEIEPGRERAFLFSTAMHVGAKAYRSRERRREVDDEQLEQRRDSVPGLEELIDRRRARELLDEILAKMPFDLRTVFVLYEVEELTMSEISAALELPHGTVASRLRRARAEIEARVQRLEARMKFPGGQP
jgi:RNA polymerase sigma-70 factor, ECF subfamily